MSKSYTPSRGDIVWLNFDPQAGKEQSGKRPALVLSDKSYNKITGLAVCCPITSQIKNYPFEVLLPDGLPIQGVVLSDHVKSIDIRARLHKYICSIPEDVLAKVVKRITLLISPNP